MSYRVGTLKYPSDDDPEYQDYHVAIEEAIHRSWDDDVIGVWDIEGNSLEAIVYMQTVFVKGGDV